MDPHRTKCISSNNEPCMARPTLIDFNPSESNQQLRCYSLMVNLDKCNGSCITFDDPAGRICVSNKTENVNINVFNMITKNFESKTLKQHISCKCKCKFDGRKCNSKQKWNSDKCRCQCKNPRKNIMSAKD